MRYVDCETTAAPTTSPSLSMGMALESVTERCSGLTLLAFGGRGRLDGRRESLRKVHEEGADPVEESLANRRGGGRGCWLPLARPEEARVAEDGAVPIHDAQPRVQTEVQLPEHTLGLLAPEPAAAREGRGEDAPLLDHGTFLRLEELPLVRIEVEQPRDRKEDQEQIEGEQAHADARKRLHGDIER